MEKGSYKCKQEAITSATACFLTKKKKTINNNNKKILDVTKGKFFSGFFILLEENRREWNDGYWKKSLLNFEN